MYNGIAMYYVNAKSFHLTDGDRWRPSLVAVFHPASWMTGEDRNSIQEKRKTMTFRFLQFNIHEVVWRKVLSGEVCFSRNELEVTSLIHVLADLFK